ncbi:MAG: DUF6513 domain-containing protein [Pseudomonadota bacterium]
MADKQIFLTGHLAAQRLDETLREIGMEDGSFEVVNVGVKVAALMTEKIIRKRFKLESDAGRVVVPGRSRMDLEALEAHYGVPFVRGPDEMIDLPEYLGKGGTPPDLSRHSVRIFAEIVEAPLLTVAEIVARGRLHAAAGGDVIDVGCQPEAPFPHLEEAVAALQAEGLKVSVDSGDVSELERAINAGADHVLSLDETSVHLVKGTGCVPVLVPKPHGDLASLLRAIDKANALGIAHIADPILDPIHFGFMTSLERYAELRRLRPDTDILMGTGNLTELTDVDSQGLTALLMGICSELNICNVLIVQVSPHTRRTVQEHDAARRVMYRAKADQSLPKGYGGGLLSLHDLRPFPYTSAEVGDMAEAIRDSNFRIEVTLAGVHVYNRHMHDVTDNPYALFPKLDVDDDGGHAFYLGYELAKAELAWKLGKRYAQDNPLDWGISADAETEDLTRQKSEGATLKVRKDKRAAIRQSKDAEGGALVAPRADPEGDDMDRREVGVADDANAAEAGTADVIREIKKRGGHRVQARTAKDTDQPLVVEEETDAPDR